MSLALIRVLTLYSDIFEYVYFARPDTVIDGIDVDESRRNMGFKLAENIRNQLGPKIMDEIDVVIPLPETAITSAQCVATALGKPYVQGFVKNRYIFRTFIMPNQEQRRKGVRAKLNPMPQKFRGKNVLLVDDSIVRGTTSREIVTMAREAGANKVFISSCAPPITYEIFYLLIFLIIANKIYRNAHIYGIDLASSSELIAHHRTSHDIARVIGADAVIYQSLPDLVAACAALSPRDPKTQTFEVGVFCGKYVTPVADDYFEHLERVRGESRKAKVVESAREAVRQGTAVESDIRIAAKGVEVDRYGNVIPADMSPLEGLNGFTDGAKDQRPPLEQKQVKGSDGQIRVRESQDISKFPPSHDDPTGEAAPVVLPKLCDHCSDLTGLRTIQNTKLTTYETGMHNLNDYEDHEATR